MRSENGPLVNSGRSAQMSRSQRVRTDDVRALLRLVGELHELPNDPDVRVAHMLECVCKLVGGRTGFVNILDPTSDGSALKLVWVGQHGSLDNDGRAAMGRLGKLDMKHQGPLINAMAKGGPRAMTLVRDKLVSKREWYRSSFFNEHLRVARLDSNMCSSFPLREPGRRFTIGMFRALGDRQFGPREWTLLELLNSEFGWFYRAVVEALNGPTRQLSRQLRRTLARLVDGDSEKQIARRMNLSKHTVHDYVKELHKRFDVSSRGELLAAVHRRSTNAGQVDSKPQMSTKCG